MQKIPNWILAIAGLFTIVPLAITIMGYSEVVGDELLGPQGLFLARNLATALVAGVSLYKRNAGMLLSAFLMRLFSDLTDITNTVVGGGPFPVAFLAFVVLAIPPVWTLWNHLFPRKA